MEYPPFDGVAAVEMLWLLEPASGSVMAKAIFCVPSPIGLSHRSFWSGVPCLARMLPTIAGETTIRRRAHVGGDLLAHYRQRPHAEAAAAVLLGHVHTEVAAARKRLPELGGRLLVADLLARVLGAEVGADLRDGLADLALLVGGDEREVRSHPLSRLTFNASCSSTRRSPSESASGPKTSSSWRSR